jgi:hypothetical protein
MNTLPQIGTAALLKVLSPHLDDAFINDLFPSKKGRGRRPLFCPAQLFRVTLLHLLTPVNSFNLLVQLLSENRAWRDFAFLANKRTLPDAKMLHCFRDRLGLNQLRAINRHLLEPFLETLDVSGKSLAIIDATDLPAATRDLKKSDWLLFRRSRRHRRPDRAARQEQVVCRV